MTSDEFFFNILFWGMVVVVVVVVAVVVMEVVFLFFFFFFPLPLGLLGVTWVYLGIIGYDSTDYSVS